MRSKNTIFIQIASYRDPELPTTVKNIIENAEYPENLVFGICRQYHLSDGFDTLEEYRGNNKQVKIIDVPYNETGGVCWARNQIQQLYNGEKYTLQLDSHHRFVEGWDTLLIKMLKDLQKAGHKKPLLTAYLPSYEPANDPQGRAQEPWKMAFDRFIPEGAIFFKPEGIQDWKTRELAVPGRFYSAHFAFTLGQFCKEVQHNPEYLFHGEEISIAARAYTWGYDLFYPHRMVAWHEYSRNYRKQVWGDDPEWSTKNFKSHEVNRKLFGMDDIPQEGHDHPVYGFGKVRSLRDYEKYSGILFSKRSVQPETLINTDPPNPSNHKTEEEWENSFVRKFKHCIDLSKESFKEEDYQFWVIALHGKDDHTIYRNDIEPSEIQRILQDPDGYCKIWLDFDAVDRPEYWVVWPFSENKGWCERITGNL